MKDIEKILQKANTEDKKIPRCVEDKIRYALNNLDKPQKIGSIFNNKDKKIYFKLVPALTMGFVLVTGISFASSYTIKHFFNYNDGIDTAIENGYILNNDMEYRSANNIGIKVENLLMDDYNLNISFSIQFDEEINSEFVSDIEFLDMIITDNDNKILYCEDKETFEKFCTTNNIEERWKETNDNYINTGSNSYLKNINESKADLIYNLYANSFPKSKLLNIEVNKIKIYAEKEVIIEGNWKVEVSIPEKFYNREVYVYQVESCSREDFSINEVIVYDTGTKIKLVTNEFPDLPYDINDDEETKARKAQEEYERMKNMTVEEYKKMKENKKFKNEYIENENGEKFYPSQSTDADGGYSNTEMKYLNYWQTFNMTKYDATDKLKIYLNYKGEDVYILLKRK